MSKYWEKQIFSHKSFSEVGEKQKKISFHKKNHFFLYIPSSYVKIWGGDFTFGSIPEVGQKQLLLFFFGGGGKGADIILCPKK